MGFYLRKPLETVLLCLTPELSRAALRRRQSHNLSGTLPTPRSGVGLNELLELTPHRLPTKLARQVRAQACVASLLQFQGT